MADAEIPLLDEEKSFSGSVEGCPGCKAILIVRENHGFPKKLLFIVANMMLCNSLPIAVIFPFLYFMVQDFHVTKSDADIGYFAGWIGSSFMAGRALTGILWGTIADKYGRKPVIFCGIMSIIVFNTLFGLSKSFWMALTTRFLLGTFNGLLGTMTAYATEICSEEHVPFSVSLVGSMWGVGLILGPALGGYLSQPAIKYPGVFAGTIFDSYPYFLQALVITIYAVMVLAQLAQLPETLHKHEVFANDGKAGAYDPKESLLRNFPLISSILVYCIWAFHDIAFSETFSLWAVSPKRTGGLGWTSTDVGQALALSGLALLFFQLVIFPSLTRLFGPILLTRAVTALSIPLLVLLPSLTSLEDTWLRVVVTVIAILKCCLGVSILSMIHGTVWLRVCISTQRGAANGLSLSVVSLFRALGPAVGGSVFAFAQTRPHASILPGDQLLFFFLGATAFISVLSTFPPFLPQSTNKPIIEDDF
ncbi:hypothetical protein SELMODRAFT_101350 [Selaginella moellendorffii]|uniref:Major facilitator superfamily (MFS) profile domain-containing protein n=1 Tax=Selaginella moellendorffii TaxID=88036 RepID=D8RTS8_SELML|nr:hypothetical protein SELMODRAFT_101350 [Selaginella moellendorffii]